MSGDLVPVPGEPESPPLIPSDPFAAASRLSVHCRTDTPELLAQVGCAVSATDPNFPKEGLVAITCIGLSFFLRQVTPAGEEPVRYAAYLALHTLDGKNYVTASNGALDYARRLADAFGRPPWPEGVPVTIGRAEPRPGKIARVIVSPGNLVGRKF